MLLRRPPQLLLAPRLRPDLRPRLRRRPRGRAPERDEPLHPLLETGRTLHSGLAHSARVAAGEGLDAPFDRGSVGPTPQPPAPLLPSPTRSAAPQPGSAGSTRRKSAPPATHP